MITSGISLILPYLVGSFILCIGLSITIRKFGRAASLSQLFHDLISLESTEMTWKGSLIAGLIFGGSLVWNLFSYGPIWGTTFQFYEHEDTFLKGTNVYGFLLSGFLTGLGTSLGGGGITGHVFCGIPRPSRRSFLATVVIFLSGFMMSTFKDRTSFLSGARASVISITIWPRMVMLCFLCAPLALLCYKLYYLYKNSLEGNEELGILEKMEKLVKNPKIFDILLSFGIGIILAVGLLVSGLSDRKKMLSFLSVDTPYFGLAYALIGGIVINLIIFQFFGPSVRRYERKEIGYVELVLGAALFGAGLGLCGLTIGTAILVAPLYFPEVYLWYLVPSCFGNIAAPYIKEGIQGLIELGKKCCCKDTEDEELFIGPSS